MRIQKMVFPLIFFGGFILVSALFVSSVHSDLPLLSTLSLDDAFQKGQELFLEEKFTEAEKVFSHCSDRGPKNADYLCWQAKSIAYELRERILKGASKISLLSKGRAVRKLYYKAVEVDPTHERALIGQAIILRDVPRVLGGNAKKAEQIFKGVIERDPKSIFGHHFLGTFYIRNRKDYELGIEYLKKAIEIGKTMDLNVEETYNHANSYHAIGKTLLQELDKPAEAVPYLKKSLKIDPDVIAPWIHLAEACRLTNQPDKAKEALRRAATSHKEHGYKYFKKDIVRVAKKLKIKKELNL